jgi:phosphatidylserine/phosphatidylglycerophosphate/cardiolipin synthase-like enzyme
MISSKFLQNYSSLLSGTQIPDEPVMGTPLEIIFNKDNFISVFNQDIVAAKKEILIVSPFARQRRTHQMIQHLKTAIGEHILITVVTRPKEDFPKKDHPVLQKALDLLTRSGINIIYKSNIHQKFAIMDQKIVWYGSINLLSYGSAQESIMRIEGSNIANELIKTIDNV